MLERFRIDNKVVFVILLSVFAVIAYMITQLFWVFFGSFGLWETWESDVVLYDNLTKVAGAIFFVSSSTILFYKLSPNQDVEKKETPMNLPTIVSNIKNVLKKLYRYILEKARIAGNFLEKTVVSAANFLYSSRKTVLLVTAVFVVTLAFSFLIASWFIGSDYTPSGDYDRSVPTTGTISVQGLEIYGGDIKYNPSSDTVYVDWGELGLGAYKNATFYVKSSSNVNVTLELNVTNWEPPGIDEYIHIFWDYDGTLLSPTEELRVTLTLEVASSGDFIDFLVANEVTAFGFDITVYASGE